MRYPRHHLSHKEGVSDEAAAEHIRQHIPEHDVLLAGFPCQPFSLAGVSKKNSLGRAHGFACDTQGTLFFDVVRIIDARRPAMFVLENVKNLKSHDQGKTFRIIMRRWTNWAMTWLMQKITVRRSTSSTANIFCRSTVNASCWWVFVAILI
ncbi:DNA (cytosine-5-)-methyltransferase [Escherichia coli]